MSAAASCDAANHAAVSQRVEITRRGYLTKAVLCDVSPPCATETLFNHEFWMQPKNPFASRVPPFVLPASSRCINWKESDWPTFEPHLSRDRAAPRVRTFWDIMRLLPNRTVWFHGDSIQLQLCDAALCSLMRSKVVGASEPVMGQRPAWLQRIADATHLNLFTTLLPNGARFVCSGIGYFERAHVEQVLPHVDVAMLNFGLHYHTHEDFEKNLRSALVALSAWQLGSPRTRIALWREGSAQHFKGGSYTRGAEKTSREGAPCECEPLSVTSSNLNLHGWRLEQRLAPQHHVGLVPFFNLTAPRHDMHRRHWCSFDRQTKPGRCCDCTHFCYTPLFWDAVFGGLYRAVRRHPAIADKGHRTATPFRIDAVAGARSAAAGRRKPSGMRPSKRGSATSRTGISRPTTTPSGSSPAASTSRSAARNALVGLAMGRQLDQSSYMD